MSTGTKSAVVIGGGTGAPISIRALLDLGLDVSAVVAMADDGGSTGILRERAGAIPPGDIRKCLVAMARNPKDPFVRAFQYRFDYAQNHALGNLILTALADTSSSFPEAIAVCEELLDTRGHVYPSTLDRVVLEGETRDGRRLYGQAKVSRSDCAVSNVDLVPADAKPYEPALQALRNADLIVLGPGSLFTSIIPTLLVPGVIEAITESRAKTVFVCSLADMQGETWGLNCAEHVEALLSHGMQGLLDFVLIHSDFSAPPAAGSDTQRFARITGEDITPTLKDGRMKDGIKRLPVNAELIDRIERMGPHVIMHDFVDPKRLTWHSPDVLQEAFREVLGSCRSRRK
ncbi:MAG: YvcK family protein [Actinobacteria bacterium]|nr:YvcK family protein [Actinomycetota bacterium]